MKSLVDYINEGVSKGLTDISDIRKYIKTNHKNTKITVEKDGSNNCYYIDYKNQNNNVIYSIYYNNNDNGMYIMFDKKNTTDDIKDNMYEFLKNNNLDCEFYNQPYETGKNDGIEFSSNGINMDLYELIDLLCEFYETVVM